MEDKVDPKTSVWLDLDQPVVDDPTKTIRGCDRAPLRRRNFTRMLLRIR